MKHWDLLSFLLLAVSMNTHTHFIHLTTSNRVPLCWKDSWIWRHILSVVLSVSLKHTAALRRDAWDVPCKYVCLRLCLPVIINVHTLGKPQSTPRGTFYSCMGMRNSSETNPRAPKFCYCFSPLLYCMFINLLQRVDLHVALLFLWRPHGFGASTASLILLVTFIVLTRLHEHFLYVFIYRIQPEICIQQHSQFNNGSKHPALLPLMYTS